MLRTPLPDSPRMPRLERQQLGEIRALDDQHVTRQLLQHRLRGAADHDSLEPPARDGAHHHDVDAALARETAKRLAHTARFQMYVFRRYLKFSHELVQLRKLRLSFLFQ